MMFYFILLIVILIASILGIEVLKIRLKRKVVKATQGSDRYTLRLIYSYPLEFIYVYVDIEQATINLVCEKDFHTTIMNNIDLCGKTPEVFIKSRMGRNIVAEARRQNDVSRCLKFGFCTDLKSQKHRHDNFKVEYAYHNL